MKDTIVYKVVTLGGGVDGRDFNDLPEVRFATLDKQSALDSRNSWDSKNIETELIDFDETMREIRNKLTKIEIAVLRHAHDNGSLKKFIK